MKLPGLQINQSGQPRETPHGQHLVTQLFKLRGYFPCKARGPYEFNLDEYSRAENSKRLNDLRLRHWLGLEFKTYGLSSEWGTAGDGWRPMSSCNWWFSVCRTVRLGISPLQLNASEPKSEPGTKLVYPKPCKELTGWSHPLVHWLPGFPLLMWPEKAPGVTWQSFGTQYPTTGLTGVATNITMIVTPKWQVSGKWHHTVTPATMVAVLNDRGPQCSRKSGRNTLANSVAKWSAGQQAILGRKDILGEVE